MQEENLLVQMRRYCRTTNNEHGYGRYPNLIKHVEMVWTGRNASMFAALPEAVIATVRRAHPTTHPCKLIAVLLLPES